MSDDTHRKPNATEEGAGIARTLLGLTFRDELPDDSELKSLAAEIVKCREAAGDVPDDVSSQEKWVNELYVRVFDLCAVYQMKAVQSRTELDKYEKGIYDFLALTVYAARERHLQGSRHSKFTPPGYSVKKSPLIDLHHKILASLRQRLSSRAQYWRAAGEKQVEAIASKNLLDWARGTDEISSRGDREGAKPYLTETLKDVLRRLASWQELEIRFTSDERIQIYIAHQPGETYNYADMDFEDSRNGKPNLAWETLRQLAKSNGVLDPFENSQRSKIEKRVEEIRKKFRNRFGLEEDPIPFAGTKYQTRFRIRCSPSIDS